MQGHNEYEGCNQGIEGFDFNYLDAPHVPEGFVVSMTGVYEVVKNGKAEIIAAPIWVSSLTRGSIGWGRILRFIDHDGYMVELSVAASKLHEGSSALIGELANAGLRITPGKERRLMAYLALAEPRERVLWGDGGDDEEIPGHHVI